MKYFNQLEKNQAPAKSNYSLGNKDISQNQSVTNNYLNNQELAEHFSFDKEEDILLPMNSSKQLLAE